LRFERTTATEGNGYAIANDAGEAAMSAINANSTGNAVMPEDVSDRVGVFDRAAGAVARVASRAPFFAFCVVLVLLWILQGVVKVVAGGGISAFSSSTYQLEINTTTTIITFLLVALLQNSQSRDDQATQHKLNALADGLADLMNHVAERDNNDDLRRDIGELRAAVGLEDRESSSKNSAV
jgi:low affinity Fe/Cu permease